MISKLALMIMLGVFGLLFGIVIICLLVYFVGVVIEASKGVGSWVLILGAVVLFFGAIQILATHYPFEN